MWVRLCCTVSALTYVVSRGTCGSHRIANVVDSLRTALRMPERAPNWRRRLDLEFGFTIDSPCFCEARSTCPINITFTPRSTKRVTCRLKVTHSTGSGVITLTGGGGKPSVRLLDDTLSALPTVAAWSASHFQLTPQLIGKSVSHRMLRMLMCWSNAASP